MYMDYEYGDGLGISFAQLAVQRLQQTVPSPPPSPPSDARVDEPFRRSAGVREIARQKAYQRERELRRQQRVAVLVPGGGTRVPERVPVVRRPVVRADPAPVRGPAVRPRSPQEAMQATDDSMTALPAAGVLAPRGLAPGSESLVERIQRQFTQPGGVVRVPVAPQAPGGLLAAGFDPKMLMVVLGVGVALTMLTKRRAP